MVKKKSEVCICLQVCLFISMIMYLFACLCIEGVCLYVCMGFVCVFLYVYLLNFLSVYLSILLWENKDWGRWKWILKWLWQEREEGKYSVSKAKKSHDCSILDRSDLQIWWLVSWTDHGYGTNSFEFCAFFLFPFWNGSHAISL